MAINDDRRKEALRRAMDAQRRDDEEERTDDGGASVRPRVAPLHGVTRQEGEPTIRRAYTVTVRHDQLLGDIAHETGTDKGYVLRHIIDEWMRSKGLM